MLDESNTLFSDELLRLWSPPLGNEDHVVADADTREALAEVRDALTDGRGTVAELRFYGVKEPVLPRREGWQKPGV